MVCNNVQVASERQLGRISAFLKCTGCELDVWNHLPLFQYPQRLPVPHLTIWPDQLSITENGPWVSWTLISCLLPQSVHVCFRHTALWYHILYSVSSFLLICPFPLPQVRPWPPAPQLSLSYSVLLSVEKAAFIVHCSSNSTLIYHIKHMSKIVGICLSFKLILFNTAPLVLAKLSHNAMLHLFLLAE